MCNNFALCALNRLVSRTRSLEQREWLLYLLSAATFLILFQAYMVAPLIPYLSQVFQVSNQTIGLVIPAYMIPYGIGSLIYGVLSDRFGRKPIMLFSLVAMTGLVMLTATAQSAEQLMIWRLLTGVSASGVIPQILTLISELFPYAERGRPLGWIFGAMAGGMALGSVFGAILLSRLTWHGLFIVVGGLSAIVLRLIWKQRHLLGSKATTTALNLPALLSPATKACSAQSGDSERMAMSC